MKGGRGGKSKEGPQTGAGKKKFIKGQTAGNSIVKLRNLYFLLGKLGATEGQRKDQSLVTVI